MSYRVRIAASLSLGLLLISSTAIRADETLKVAVGQRGSWDTSVSELGQKAGSDRYFFKGEVQKAITDWKSK